MSGMHLIRFRNFMAWTAIMSALATFTPFDPLGVDFAYALASFIFVIVFLPYAEKGSRE